MSYPETKIPLITPNIETALELDCEIHASKHGSPDSMTTTEVDNGWSLLKSQMLGMMACGLPDTTSTAGNYHVGKIDDWVATKVATGAVVVTVTIQAPPDQISKARAGLYNLYTQTIKPDP